MLVKNALKYSAYKTITATMVTYKKCLFFRQLLFAAFLAPLIILTPELHAQTAFNASRIIPVSALANIAPDMGEGGEITGAAGYYTGTKLGEKSPADVEAFLNSRDNWFRSVGKGGSPFTKPVALPDFAKILSVEDEKNYREAFRLIDRKKYREAVRAAHEAENPLLLGHVEAARLLSEERTGIYALKDWLEKYSDLPEASDIHAKAKKLSGSESGLTRPASFASFFGSAERADGSGTMEWKAGGIRALMAKGGLAPFVKLLDKGNIAGAETKLREQEEQANLDGAQISAARLALAELLLRRNRTERAWELVNDLDVAVAQFDDGAKAYALWLKGLIAWSQDYPINAFAAFSNLAEMKDLPGPNRAGAAFWGARAAERITRNDQTRHFLQIAAQYPRSFYGVLALNSMNAAAEYNWTIPDFNKHAAGQVTKHSAGMRALALLQLEERPLAEAELRGMPGQENRELRNGILALAAHTGLPSLSLLIGSGMSQSGTIDAALYPLMPWHPEDGYASDPALVLAVAKNESHFNYTARSPAGALGVMQVMPGTAELVRAGSSRNLYDPQINVTLGDRYLDMLTRTEGIRDNLLFIIGSYNCGPERMLDVYDKAKTQSGDDPLLFIETFPIKETRDYMQKVMATYWVYRARFNKPLKAMAALAIGGWPQYKPDDVKLTER